MSERVHLLAQSILGKSSLEQCSLQEIRELVQRYPYFAPAQFLYLQKLKSENAEEYSKQLQKAVLYYHNPLAFEYFISSDRFHTEIDLEPQKPQPAIEATVEEPKVEDFEIINTQQENETVDDEFIPETLPVKEETAPLPVEASSDSVNEPAIPVEQTETKLPETKNVKPETTLAFEPFHTVDYFASQGIKLSQEEASKDKFGRQLKSFTEWLKSMKRLPSNQVGQMDASTEKKVEHMAEDSVHNADVITEAMAEVWLKQGNREKAIETYNKLSLQNPSKRAYFATLIENLKRS